MLHTFHADKLLFLLAALGIGLLGATIAWGVWGKRGIAGDDFAREKLGFVYKASFERLWWDEGYQKFIVRPLVLFATGLWWVVDVLIIDRLLVEGVGALARFVANLVRLAQNGDAQRYAAFVTVGALVIVFLVAGAAMGSG